MHPCNLFADGWAVNAGGHGLQARRVSSRFESRTALPAGLLGRTVLG